MIAAILVLYFTKMGMNIRRKSPQKHDMDMVFGIRALIEAIKAGKTIDKIFTQKGLKNPLISELYDLIDDRDIPNSKVPVEKLNRITTKNHQGAIGFISPVDFASLDNVVMNAFEKGEDPFILILDRITDVRNFGAIARTAECAGVHGILVPTKGAAQIGADAMKTSAGALNYLSVCREHNLKEAIMQLKESGLKVFACTEKSAEVVYDANLSGPVAIIMGSEEDGVSPAYQQLCDGAVKIPMQGKIDSLNVSVATAVVVYEVVRQRGVLDVRC
ncbi:MAG: 23S rRNA (guanosine(2251)-2'-O)-methyltransferase RlmB [Cyclobacteriaceae bacterium]